MSTTEIGPVEAEAPPPEGEPTENGEAPFEPSPVDIRRAGASPEALALPAIDGEAPDRIEVQFTGGVRLDRSDPADVALMRALALGKEIDLRIVGVVRGKVGTVSWDEDGYPGETTHAAKVRITTVYRPVGDGVEARVGDDQLDIGGQPEAEA
jgi:hypothetical protein